MKTLNRHPHAPAIAERQEERQRLNGQAPCQITAESDPRGNQRSDLSGILESLADRVPDQRLFAERISTGNWVHYSAKQVWDECKSLSHFFRQMNLLKGERIAVMGATSLRWQIAEMAAYHSGAVVVGVDADSSVDQIRQVLENADVTALATDSIETMERLPSEIREKLRFAVLMDRKSASTLVANVYSWDRAQQIGRGILADCKGQSYKEATVLSSDPATLIYTSGTTGEPKGILFTHGQLRCACQAVLDAVPDVTERDSLLAWLPMAHLFQRELNLVAMARGGTIYYSREPRAVIEALRECRPTVFIGVPRFYEKVFIAIREQLENRPRPLKWLVDAALQSGKRLFQQAPEGQELSLPTRINDHLLNLGVLHRIRKALGGNVRIMITGSAPIAPEILEFFHAAGLPVYEAYGISENAIPMALNRIGDVRFGSVGKPLKDNEIRLTPEGEVLVKGPGLFDGYWGEADSREYLTTDGYFRTGDIGYMDEDGFLYLRGRKSSIFKTSTGRRISPERVERLLEKSPLIDHVVVVGQGRPYPVGLVTLNTQEITACIRRDGKPAPPSSELAVSAEVHQQVERDFDARMAELSGCEQLGGFVVLPQPLSVQGGELTSSLKIKRSTVERKYAALIQGSYDKIGAVRRLT